MKNHYRTVSLSVLMVASCFGIEVYAQTRSTGVLSTNPCPDEAASTGLYENHFYGFSIRIPSGRNGFWNSPRCAKAGKEECACMTDHGRIIPLSQSASIEAFASYSEPRFSTVDYEKLALGFRDGPVEVISSKTMQLARLRALRVRVSFIEGNSRLVEDRIATVHRGVDYQLVLRSPETAYMQAQREFERVIQTWRLIRRMK